MRVGELIVLLKMIAVPVVGTMFVFKLLIYKVYFFMGSFGVHHSVLGMSISRCFASVNSLNF